MWTTCVQGHDLSGEDAYLVDAQGNRRCRLCVATEKRTRREPRTDGAFQ